MLNAKVSRVSLGYKFQPVTVVVAILGWIIKCIDVTSLFRAT
jgi:hypothetical protein